MVAFDRHDNLWVNMLVDERGQPYFFVVMHIAVLLESAAHPTAKRFARGWLGAADVIAAVVDRRPRASFYVNEAVREILEGKGGNGGLVRVALVVMDADSFTRQARKLRKIVEELKGDDAFYVDGGNLVGEGGKV